MKANCEMCGKPINLPDHTDAYVFAYCGEKCRNSRNKFEEKHSDEKLNPFIKEMARWLRKEIHWKRKR